MDMHGVIEAQLIEPDRFSVRIDRKRSPEAKRQTVERKRARAWKAAER